MIPLVLVMLAQALIAYGTVVGGGTADLLADNSVDILQQDVKSKKIILENDMMQTWSRVKREKEQTETALHFLLKERKATVSQFLEEDSLQKELLREMFPACLNLLRKNKVSGSFMILGNPKERKRDFVCDGIYVRDMDPDSNPANYSDVLLERGSSELVKELGIPLAALWTTDFHFGEPGGQDWDHFYYRPRQAAEENPRLSYQNLGYWSAPFLLSGKGEKESYQVITYSIPLLYEDTVYGVMGTEVSCDYLQKQIAAQKFEKTHSYMLARYDKENKRLFPMVNSGFPTGYISQKGIPLSETKYPSLFQVSTEEDSCGPVYAAISELNLYVSHTPFEKEVWVLVGLENHDSLFGFSENIIWHFVIGISVAFFIGCIAVYLVTGLITFPIRKLAELIRISPDDKLGDFKRSNIIEVDELYDVVHHLTIQQKENEYILLEEKERYRIALGSSTDHFFTYDVKREELELINIESRALSFSGRTHYSRWELIEEPEIIHPEYHHKVAGILDGAVDEVEGVILGRLHSGEEYWWMQLKGTVIYDANGIRSKIIGSIKNIDQEKRRELQELEEKRKDYTTGLLKKEAGQRLIESELRQQVRGCLVLLDIDQFREINEKYGMVLGDAILEEIGKAIGNMGDAIIGVRIGGDEFLWWMGGYSREEAHGMVDSFRKKVRGWYPGSTLHIHLSAGIAEYTGGCVSYEELLKQAKKELYQRVKAGGLPVTPYEQTHQEKEINGIARVSYSDRINIISLVFNFFDKGGGLASIMAVMLNKLGNYFHADSLKVVMTDRDFYASYLKYGWQEGEEKPEQNEIRYLPREEFYQLTESIGDKYKNQSGEREQDSGYTLLHGLLPKQAKFLFVSPEERGITVPMYDKEDYIGSVSFIQKGNKRAEWSEQDKNDMQKIVKIIESNINREKHDLASQAKSDFLSRMSHEIRTPMNAIMGMTTIALLEKERSEKVEDCLVKISQSSRYLLGLINHILDMSKIESGKMKLEIGKLNLTDMIRGVEDMIRPQAEKKGIHYRFHGSIRNNWVMGDELRLSQVLVNLLGNAVKFTPKGGNITFLAEQQSTSKEKEIRLLFAVQDDGVGISPENAERIFLSFEQVESTVGKESPGTGLGLAISSHLIRMMGGDIELESKLGEGSRFYFTLDMEVGEAGEEQEGMISQPPEEELAGSRVLVVEDNSLNAEITKTLMEIQGFVVDVASDGQEAVDQFAASGLGYYDMILMDIRMPVMDGLEATKQIRRMERADGVSIPIIAMTANAFDEDMKKSVACGMNGHLTKPIDRKRMNEMIKKVFAERRKSLS